MYPLGPLGIRDPWGVTVTESDNDHKERSSKYQHNTPRQSSKRKNNPS